MSEGLYADVRAVVDAKLEAGETVALTWVTHQVVANRSGIEGPDVEFYRLCAFDAIQRIAKRVIGRYEPKATPDDQPTLEGFEHAQRAYPVERGGERVLVPTDQLTTEELEARADEYVRMGNACLQHAKELRYLARSRQIAAE